MSKSRAHTERGRLESTKAPNFTSTRWQILRLPQFQPKEIISLSFTIATVVDITHSNSSLKDQDRIELIPEACPSCHTDQFLGRLGKNTKAR